MITVQQGKQIASLINDYEVHGWFAKKALEEDNNEDYRKWDKRRDLVMVVLMKKYNIELPNANRAFESLTFDLGAEKLNKQIEWEYNSTVEYSKTA